MTEADLASLARPLHARAAGLWRVEADQLVREAFWATAEMPADVARAFESATRSVPRAAGELAIVRASTLGEPVESIAEELPEDAGSGYWLRRFGARRSVAVPVSGFVLSVALPDLDPPAQEVVDRLQEAFSKGSRS